MNQPTVGRIVMYVFPGPPLRRLPALVNDVTEGSMVVGLMVSNLAGIDFHPLASGGVPHDPTGTKPGTWHWPEVHTSVGRSPVPSTDGEGQ